MNKELFCSMQRQMQPSREVRDALTAKLASTKKKTVPVGRYVAIAACVAVIVAAVPVYGMVRDHLKWQAVLDGYSHKDAIVETTQPHSYVLASELYGQDSPENTIDTGGTGDQDQDMTPGELTDNMLEAGFTQEDVDGYLASGWQMTWAKWWKFYHQSEETGDRTLEALLDFFREEGLAVNTGEAPVEIPGGAYIGGAPDQSGAIMAYQNLMDRFKADYGPDRYPEWYGGAYIDDHAGLIVNIAASYEEQLTDKELYFQIWDWAGSDRVGFGSSPQPLNDLRSLQDKVGDAMYDLGLDFGCGVNEETGQVELTLPAATEEALWALARLDPAGADILVIVGEFISMDLARRPAPSVSHDIQPGG